MLPKPLYEILPYLCIFLSALIFASQSGPVLMFSSLLLFLAGSKVWVLRANHRRYDRVRFLLDPDSLVPHHRRLVLPNRIYESLPFVYLAVGWVVLVAIEPLVGQLAGGLMVVLGMQVWRMRYQRRMKPAAIMAVV